MFCCFCNQQVKVDGIYFYNTHGNKKIICNKCFDEKNINIAKCEECGEYFEYNYCVNSTDFEEDLSTYCHKCALDKVSSYCKNECNLNYYYKPDPIFFGGEKNENKLFMGIELETSDGNSFEDVKKLKEYMIFNKDVNPNGIGYGFFYGKGDASLDENSIEIVSHPATLDFHKNTDMWKKLLEKVKNAGLKSNDCSCCGIHIHINKNYFTTEEVQKLDALVNIHSITFRRFARRNSRHYAVYNPNKTLNNLGVNNDGNSRYSCLNFHNENTIEFRIFKGNTKYESIMALFELIQGTCDFIKQENITIPFIYGDKHTVLTTFKEYLENRNFDYLPRYTEMCRVWRDINQTND